jgi:hypothetical protein
VLLLAQNTQNLLTPNVLMNSSVAGKY